MVRWGTPGYMAPEILHKIPCTTAIDMFSLGAVLYKCACGEDLCMGHDTTSVLLANLTYNANKVSRLKVKLGSEGVDLVGRLLRFNPASRPYAHEANSHKALEEDDCDQVGEGLGSADFNSTSHDDAVTILGSQEVIHSDRQMLDRKENSSRKSFVHRLVSRVLSGITKWRVSRGKNKKDPHTMQVEEPHFSDIFPVERDLR